VNFTAGTDVYTRHLYDGNNLVAELAASSSSLSSPLTLLRSFTWGLDLAGSLTTTGGVGALVQISDHSSATSYFPTYDGNGNVASLLRASDGAAAAKYEYSPFGELLRCEGTYAKENPFRFSTKFTDDESGLVYYGARYYAPMLGRFINRDPIEEQGGLNLYGFCGNDGINHTDYLGNFSLRKIFRKIRKFVAGHSDPLTRAIVRADQRLDDWSFKTLQKNPWVVSAVTTVLSFTPLAWVSPIISAAWTMENGGNFGQVAWAYVGGRISNGIVGGALRGAGGFFGTVAHGYLAGGINGGIASYAAGGSFSSGFRNGGYIGAAFATGGYAWQNRATIGASLGRMAHSVKASFLRFADGSGSGSNSREVITYGDLVTMDVVGDVGPSPTSASGSGIDYNSISAASYAGGYAANDAAVARSGRDANLFRAVQKESQGIGRHLGGAARNIERGATILTAAAIGSPALLAIGTELYASAPIIGGMWNSAGAALYAGGKSLYASGMVATGSPAGYRIVQMGEQFIANWGSPSLPAPTYWGGLGGAVKEFADPLSP
jgi:RHS repeat-associated protein